MIDTMYVLKDTRTGMYYSEDGAFIEPNKENAKKMRTGQAKNTAFNKNKWLSKSFIVLEEV